MKTALPLFINPTSQLAERSFLELAEALENETLRQVVRRLIVKDRIRASDAECARIRFLQYALLSSFVDGPLAPGPWEDLFWHAFILHTVDYEEFCTRHFGYFIHHVPTDPDIQADSDHLIDTRVLRQTHFLGPPSPSHSGAFAACNLYAGISLGSRQSRS